MANMPNITDEEIQFRKRARRRLVGAVVLVLLVVVTVPWLLPAEEPPQEAQPIDIHIPPRDASGFAPRIQPAVPAETAAAGTSGSTAVSPPQAAVTPTEAATEAPAEKPPRQAVPAVPATPTEKPATVDASPAKTAGERFYVQYGAFSEPKNAAQRQAELKAKGIATFTEVVKTSAGDKIRVRSGPYDSREAAEKVQLKAKPLDSKLVPVDGKG